MFEPVNHFQYGFRFYSTQSGGGGRPAIFEGLLASGYAPFLGSSFGITVGDPVARLADGTYEIAGTTVDTQARTYGVVMGFSHVKQPTGKCQPVGNYLRSGPVYTRDADATRILIAPFSDHIWECYTFEGAGSTLADYRDLIGTNVGLAYLPSTDPPDKPQANPYLTVGGVTGPLDFRLVGISDNAANVDFSQDFVRLLVQLNMGADPMIGPDGTDGL